MSYRLRFVVVAFATFAAAGIASAQCPPDCPVKGGGSDKTDCHVELASDVLHANYPVPPKKSKEIRCFDGDNCDLDGIANNSCTFDVDLCFHNADPSLPDCAVADVTAVTIDDPEDFPELASLQTAASALMPATTNVCTTGKTVTIPLVGPDDDGVYEAAKFSFKVSTDGAKDKDKIRFRCVPRGWPSHGYDAANTRATPIDTGIRSTNVATLVEKWSFAVAGGPTGPGCRRPITSTVTVGPDLVYTTGWDGKVYALDKKSGNVKWTFHTHPTHGQSFIRGVQSSVTLTPDGRALVANSDGVLFSLDAKTGKPVWQVDAASEDPLAGHAWASPVLVNNDMILMGIASHNDAPCTRGTLVAYDLAGNERWRQHTVPERICFNDTTIECDANTDCAPTGSPCLLAKCDGVYTDTCTNNGDCDPIFLKPGECVAPPPATTGECLLERSVSCTSNSDCPSCVPGFGGGVTATPAVSADGHDVYMSSVGCLTRPSIGNSDSIFKLDAETGDIEWAFRTESIEQFGAPGALYHDYGFLNGPILSYGSTPLAVAGGKDGTLYAVNQATGALEWLNVVTPAPTPSAGYGLFNGALAYDASSDRFYAALYGGQFYPDANDHLMSFKGGDGSIDWSKLPGGSKQSWSSVTIANDVLYAGTTDSTSIEAYNKNTGALLVSLPVPAGQVSGGVAVDNGVVYVPYGEIGVCGQGGVVAYELP